VSYWLLLSIGFLLGWAFCALAHAGSNADAAMELIRDRDAALEFGKPGKWRCECGWTGDELVNEFCCPRCEEVPALNPNNEAFKAAYLAAQKMHAPNGAEIIFKPAEMCRKFDFDHTCQCADCRAERIRRSVEFVVNRRQP